jgi:hypothetical protein
VKPAQLANLMIEQQWVEEPRRLTEIVDAIDELVTKVWYNRHQVRRERVENGKTKLVEKETFPIKDHRTRPIQRDIWEGALKAAAEVDKRFGLENLGPWDDFEWGMLNGFAASEAACLLGLQRAASLVTWRGSSGTFVIFARARWLPACVHDWAHCRRTRSSRRGRERARPGRAGDLPRLRNASRPIDRAASRERPDILVRRRIESAAARPAQDCLG